MRTNKLHLNGLKEVFSFTLRQLFKTRSNIVMIVILVILALASSPVLALISGGAFRSNENGEITSVTVINHTGLDLSGLEKAPGLAYDLEVVGDSGDDMTFGLILSLREDGGEYMLANDVYPTPYSETELDTVMAQVSRLVQNCRLSSLGLTDETVAVLEKDVSSSYYSLENTGSEFGSSYMIQLVYSVIVMMVSIIAAGFIVKSIVEEKVSKLVETMVISVDPPAMIFGKILAILVFTVFELACIIAAAVISAKVTSLFLDTSAIASLSDGIGVMLSNLNAPSVIIVVIDVLIGCVSFSLISGVSCVGCSTMEDSGNANSVSMLLIMGGYLISLLWTTGGSPSKIMSVIPFLSVFVAPAQFIIGNIGFVTVLIGWVLQAAVIALLISICSRVYKDLIFYKGSRLKFMQILSSAFASS